MHKSIIVAIVGLATSTATIAYAQQHDPMMHQQHMASENKDTRQLVNFPLEMRQHILSNMRDHLLAMSEILTALSAADYAKAAAIADARLGMDSPSAEGCKEESVNRSTMSKLPENTHDMAAYMPPDMLAIGKEMHRSASDFAVEARKASNTGDGKAALAAFSRVTHNCTTCHSSYRVW